MLVAKYILEIKLNDVFISIKIFIWHKSGMEWEREPGQSFLIIAFSFFVRKCFEIEMGNLIGSLRMNKTTKEKAFRRKYHKNKQAGF